jgi:hypothetical protein
MTKSLLVLPLVVASACVDSAVYPELPADPTTAVQSRPEVTAGDAPIVIATGGVQGIAIDDVRSVGFSGDATAGFRVEPFDNVWPNTKKAEYWVRALAAGTGSFEIVTNQGIAGGSVESADVASVALVPQDYELDGHSPFAIDISRPRVQAIVLDATNRRLVDATLGLDGEQTAWDRVTVPATVGRLSVHVWADSLGDRELAIELADHVDRVETVVSGNRTCFHAYAGSTEIATTLAIDGTPDPRATNCALGAASLLHIAAR